MPELPEVETTVRAITPYLLNQKVQKAASLSPKMRYPMPELSHLTGHTIIGITRRAKYILINLSNAETLIIHLGMSGRMSTEIPKNHTHFSLQTAKGIVYLRDPRRFGLVLLLPTKSVSSHPLLSTLGPEPLEDTFTPQTLHKALSKRGTPIKPTIMMPSVVVGVGNIYASESLFHARINPHKPANTLTLAECERLHATIRQTLTRAIETGGSSLRDYAQPSGELGNFQNDFYVYDCTGLPCRICQTPISQVVQAQRSTWFCAKCQPLGKSPKKAKSNT